MEEIELMTLAELENLERKVRNQIMKLLEYGKIDRKELFKRKRELIFDYIDEQFNIPKSIVIGRCRKFQYVAIRYTLTKLFYDYLNHLVNVGLELGNRHHSTVIHSLKKYNDLRYSDDEFDYYAELIEKEWEKL